MVAIKILKQVYFSKMISKSSLSDWINLEIKTASLLSFVLTRNNVSTALLRYLWHIFYSIESRNCFVRIVIWGQCLKKKIVEEDLPLLHWFRIWDISIMSWLCYQMTFAHHVKGIPEIHDIQHVMWHNMYYVMTNVTCGTYITLNETKYVIWNLTFQ